MSTSNPASHTASRRAAKATKAAATTPPTDPPGDGPSYPIGSVDKALRLLMLVSEHPEGIRVNEASAGLGVAPSTAHRLLRMIAHYGFVEQDPESKTYLPGPALQRMGRPRERFLEAARPVLRDLAEETQETVHLSVLEQAFAVTLLTAEGPHMLRVGDRTGHALPAWSSAMGRCLLFAHDDAAVRALVPSAMTTPDGSPMAQALLERVRADRGDGFAHHDGEVESGVSVAAVPVRDPAGGVAYAIGMTYPTVRIDREALPAAVTRLRAAAASLTVTLAAG